MSRYQETPRAHLKWKGNVAAVAASGVADTLTRRWALSAYVGAAAIAVSPLKVRN